MSSLLAVRLFLRGQCTICSCKQVSVNSSSIDKRLQNCTHTADISTVLLFDDVELIYGIFTQYTATLVSLLLYLSLGICQGFSAALIPLLERRESKINVTNIESSWMGNHALRFNLNMIV